MGSGVRLRKREREREVGGKVQGVKRDYLFTHYLSVEVENSSGHVVKEKDRRVLSGKRLRVAACSNLSGC